MHPLLFYDGLCAHISTGTASTLQAWKVELWLRCNGHLVRVCLRPPYDPQQEWVLDHLCNAENCVLTG
jgi:hypothetical protein